MIISILTTTGFTTYDYELWPPAAQMVLYVVTYIGACAGSGTGSPAGGVDSSVVRARNCVSWRAACEEWRSWKTRHLEKRRTRQNTQHTKMNMKSCTEKEPETREEAKEKC